MIINRITDGEYVRFANSSRRFSEDDCVLILDDYSIFCILPHIDLKCTIIIDRTDDTAIEPTLVGGAIVFDFISYRRSIGEPDVAWRITIFNRWLILNPANVFGNFNLISPIPIDRTNY